MINNKRRFLMNKHCETTDIIRNYILRTHITDKSIGNMIMKRSIFTFLTDHQKDMKKILFWSVCLISYFLYYKHIPPLLLLLGWSTLIIELPRMFNLLSSIGMKESRNVSDVLMITIPLTFIQPSIRDKLVNSWAVRPFKF